MIPVEVLNSWDAVFLVAGKEEMKPKEHVCKNCKWLEDLPFSNEYICTNDNSQYADCPSDYPENDTCEEWESSDE